MDIRIYKSGLPMCYYENVMKTINNQFSYLNGDPELCEELLLRVQKYIEKKLETKEFEKKAQKTRHG